MSVTASKRSLLAILFGLLRVADVHGQSGGRDLPRGLRSLAGISLNEDSAATVRTKLGRTREQRVGAGHHDYVSWCYVPAELPRGVLELMSDARDMGTPGLALNVIRLRAEAPPADREGCVPLPSAAGLSTPAGLGLGLSLTKIVELLGQPTRRGADSLIYYFDAKQDLRLGSPEYQFWNTPEHRETCFDAGLPYANVAASVIVLARDGRAVEVRIERNDQSIC